MEIEGIINQKLFTCLEQASEERGKLRDNGLKMALTNGCFDLLHPGHIAYLQEASKLADKLWIALNSDESVKKLKGPTRPILSAQERAYFLAAFECVDRILIFSTPRLDKEILTLKPDVYVKAGDYTLETLDKDEACALQQVGAKIHFMPFIQGYSTTKLIEKIKHLPTHS